MADCFFSLQTFSSVLFHQESAKEGKARVTPSLKDSLLFCKDRRLGEEKKQASLEHDESKNEYHLLPLSAANLLTYCSRFQKSQPHSTASENFEALELASCFFPSPEMKLSPINLGRRLIRSLET